MKHRSNQPQSRTSSDEAETSHSERRQSRTTATTETGQVSGQVVSTAGAAVDTLVQRVPQAAAPQEPGLGPLASARAEAIRERFEDRPAAVPDDNSRQNLASLQRSKQAQHDATPAGETGVPETVRDVLSSPGRSLDSDVKNALEDRLGSSLDHVQIHTGAAAQQACQELNARAFTVGNSIAFGPGEYDPQSTAGQHLIAHEVVHTLQQPDAPVSMTPVSMMPKTDLQMEIDPDPQAEREAEDVATQIMDGGDLGSQQMQGTDVHVQRVGSAVFTMASSAKNLLEMQRDQRRLEQEAQAAKFETLGNTEGDTEQRLSQLENAVSELGSYVASQVGPGPTLGEKMKSAVTDNVVTTAAGLTVGAGLAYAGLQTGSPEMAMASAPATAMTSTYAKHRAPDVNAVASQMAPDWADDIGGLVKHYVDKLLGGRESGAEYGGLEGVGQTRGDR